MAILNEICELPLTVLQYHLSREHTLTAHKAYPRSYVCIHKNRSDTGHWITHLRYELCLEFVTYLGYYFCRHVIVKGYLMISFLQRHKFAWEIFTFSLF